MSGVWKLGCRRLLAYALGLFATLSTGCAQTVQSDAEALSRAADAVLGVQVEAVDGAYSAATLGPLRQGSGVVIDDQGLVLTIGYLVLEADQITLLTDDGRKLPARVVAYDMATGFALLQSLAPLNIAPAASPCSWPAVNKTPNEAASAWPSSPHSVRFRATGSTGSPTRFS
jgi:serine protease Do